MRQKLFHILFIVVCMLHAQDNNANPVNPQPGENLWHILAAVGTEVDALLANPCDTSTTYTLFNTILNKECTISSKIDVISTTGGSQTEFDQTFTIIHALSLCMPIPIISSTVITNPGHYCLAFNLVDLTDPIITISSSDVLLDLNGNTLSASMNDAIQLDDSDSNKSNIVIKNGNFELQSVHGINFLNNDFTHTFSNIVLENLQINYTVSTGNAIEIHKAHGLRMSNCITNGALIIDNSLDLLIENCAFNAGPGSMISTSTNIIMQCCSFDLNQADGLFVSVADNLLTENCSFNQNATNGSGSGMTIFNSRNLHIKNCSFDGISTSMQQNGIFIQASNGSSNNMLFEDCTLNRNFINGMLFLPSNNATIGCAKILRCTANGNAIDGFSIVGGPNTVSDILLENCFACENAQNGFEINAGKSAAALDICLINCVAKDNTINGYQTIVAGGGSISGLFKECQAVSNATTAGFNEAGTAGSSFSYVANAAKGNGTNPAGTPTPGTDTNYFVAGSASVFVSPGPGTSTFFEQFDLSPTNTLAYWDNITMPF